MAISGISKTEQVDIILSSIRPEHFETCKEYQDAVWRSVKESGSGASERFTRSKAKQEYELYK